MKSILNILPYIQIGISAILIVAISLQRSSAGLGGAFGESGFDSASHSRRGFEKVLFITTIVLAILFALSAFVVLIIR